MRYRVHYIKNGQSAYSYQVAECRALAKSIFEVKYGCKVTGVYLAE